MTTPNETARFNPGDIVRLKSGSPNLTVLIQKDNTVRCSYWHENMKQPQTCDLPPLLLEYFSEHAERQKDEAALAEGGLLRLPPGATDKNTLVLMFPSPEIKEQFLAEQMNSNMGVQTIFGSGGPNQIN